MPLPLAGALFGRNAARGLARSASGLRGAAPGVAIGMDTAGARQIARTFRQLELNAQRKVLRPGVKDALSEAHREVLININGRVLKRHRGILWGAFADTKTQIRNSRRGGIAGQLPFPTREELGIDASDPHFWPAAIEYGHPRAPAHPYLRPAIDENRDKLEGIMSRGIAAGVLRIARQNGFRPGVV